MPTRSESAARVAAIAAPLLVAALLLGAWQCAVVASGTHVFPSPTAVALGVRELARRGVLFASIKSSLGRVGAGFALAVAVGVPLGLAMGSSQRLAIALNPVVQVLRPISPLAWIPVAIVLFGIGNTSTVFLIFLGAVFPVVTSAVNAVRAIPVIYLRVGRNFGLSRTALLTKIALPAALPQLLVGLRIALGIAWMVVVAAEMIAVDSGLGYLILDARNAGKRYDLVVAGMVIIGLIGLGLDVGMRRVERMRAVRWGFPNTR